MGDHELVLGDCIQGMRGMETDSVAHVVTDPPYAPRSMKNMRTADMIQRRDGEVRSFGYAALTPKTRADAAVEFARLARRWVLVWCDIESAQAWRDDLESAGLEYVRTGVWVREHGAPQFSGDRPAQGVETCVIMHGWERKRWRGGGRPAAWVGSIVNSAHPSRVHSSPKPEWLMEALISDFTDPGELVLDPFAGSGTTLVACKRLGRKAIGFEKDPIFHAAAVKRIEAARQQGEFFARGPRPKQQRLLP